MLVTALQVEGARNLARVQLALGPRFNVFYGDNGQGKTNLIETVYVLATLRSFRTSRLADLVSLGGTRAQLAAGRIRPLGVTAAKRSPLLPDVPTLDEQGLKGFDMSTWTGLVAPADTPDAVLNRMSTETARVLAMPDVRQRINDLGMVPVGNSPEQFGAYIRSEFAKWENAVKLSGATVE